MGNLRVSEWRKLPMNITELCINTTLRCGQSFRWKQTETGDWSCALNGRIMTVRQDSLYLHYRAIFPDHQSQCHRHHQRYLLTPPPSTPGSTVSPNTTNSEKPTCNDDTEALVEHYFNFSVNLTSLYAQWSAADANFRRRAPKFTGIRILRQDAWEALVGFICSSNNNIARISQMVDKLCRNYGPLLGEVDGQSYYDFPQPQALVGESVEAHLRELGFGYRARYLHQTAKMVVERGVDWLNGMRNPESPMLGMESRDAGLMGQGGRDGYRKAHEALLGLQGVGPKVADCVCLMGLGWGEAVPVDTHVWQIAQRDYRFGKGKHSSLTKATYDAVGDKFRGLWGKEAGWAHSVLFTADLRSFSDRLVKKIEEEKVIKAEYEDEFETKPVKVRVRRERVVPMVSSVKREHTEEPGGLDDVHHDMMSRVKRRQRQNI